MRGYGTEIGCVADLLVLPGATITDAVVTRPARALVRALHEAVWYGCSAANIVYERDHKLGVRVREWMPFASDTLAFDQYGNLAMRVGSAYINEPSVTDLGFDSLVHMFDDNERRAVILHRVFTTELVQTKSGVPVYDE